MAAIALAPVYEANDEDDGLYRPEVAPKKDTRSKLIRSKEKYAGHVINACPFDRNDGHLDEQAYCDHLVGFTDMDDPTIYYPIKTRPGGRFRFVDGTDPQPVLENDVTVRITTCYRVYRRPERKSKAKE